MVSSRRNSSIFPIYTRKSGESWLLIYPWYFITYNKILRGYFIANCTKYHIIRSYKLFHGVIWNVILLQLKLPLFTKSFLTQRIYYGLKLILANLHFKNSIDFLFKKLQKWSAWVAQSVERPTLDLRVMISGS